MSNRNLGRSRKAAMRGSVSLLALGLLAATGAAYAQSTPDSGAMETVIVTGVRASIKSALQIKKNADTVVEFYLGARYRRVSRQIGLRRVAARSGHHGVASAIG